MKIKIYTIPDCNACKELKDMLKSKGLDYPEEEEFPDIGDSSSSSSLDSSSSSSSSSGP